MKPRFSYAKAAPGVFDAMDALENYLAGSSIEAPLIRLINMRVSQINGCAYCLDMHWKDLMVQGENPQRVYSLDAWEECPYYSARERAALAWAESVTHIADGHAPESAYEAVRSQFSEKEMADLTLAISTINAWNRLSIASRLTPGTYQPASAAVATS